jgi:dihydrodipicolinate synthase/N-acetylneuraminate lyase
MDASERVLLVSSIRKALDNEGIKIPLIVGCGQQSKRATLQTIKEAKEAGGDFALVLPPSYWPTAMTKGNVTGYFKELADESELPILVYNFPLVANGIMVDSDQLIELAGHDNVVGCKLTCGVSRLFVFTFCHSEFRRLSYPRRTHLTDYTSHFRAITDNRISETFIEQHPIPTQNISQSWLEKVNSCSTV